MNAEKYKQAADELSERITHLSVVSQDTAYREGFNLHALRRAQHAAEEDKVFLNRNLNLNLYLNKEAT